MSDGRSRGLTAPGIEGQMRALKRAYEDARIDPATVAASPFAQIEVVGDHGRALMVLGNDDAGLTSWYSPDRRIVFLRNGALAGTSGLAQDIVNVRFVGEDPFVLGEVEHADAFADELVEVLVRRDDHDLVDQ